MTATESVSSSSTMATQARKISAGGTYELARESESLAVMGRRFDLARRRYAETPVTQPADARQTGTSNGQTSTATPLRVVGLQKWEGRVVEVYESTFTAELAPLGHEGPTMYADFHTYLLSPEDSNLQVGDGVYLTVRTVIGPGGRPERTASLRRRLQGKWTRDDIEQIKAKVQEVLESLGRIPE